MHCFLQALKESVQTHLEEHRITAQKVSELAARTDEAVTLARNSTDASATNVQLLQEKIDGLAARVTALQEATKNALSTAESAADVAAKSIDKAAAAASIAHNAQDSANAAVQATDELHHASTADVATPSTTEPVQPAESAAVSSDQPKPPHDVSGAGAGAEAGPAGAHGEKERWDTSVPKEEGAAAPSSVHADAAHAAFPAVRFQAMSPAEYEHMDGFEPIAEDVEERSPEVWESAREPGVERRYQPEPRMVEVEEESAETGDEDNSMPRLLPVPPRSLRARRS